MNAIEKSYTLTPETCDAVAEEILNACAAMGVARKEAQSCRLTAEECLLYWMDHGCAGKNVTLRITRRFLTPCVRLEAEGPSGNPFRAGDDALGEFCDALLVNLRLAPDYSYGDGRNRVLFRLSPKSPGQMATLGLVLAAAVAVGALGAAFLPAEARRTLLSAVVEPVYDTFFRLLSCIAGPMIFLSVAWGIYGIGDAGTFGRIGRRMMRTFILAVFLAAAFGSVCFPFLGPGFSGAAAQGGQLAGIAELILSFFPSSVAEPFVTGNTLQIIFLAVVVGIALLFLGSQTSSVARAIEQVNAMVQFLMRIISRLVPFVIFLVVVNLAWSDRLAILAAVWKLVAVFLPAAAVYVLAVVLWTAAAYRARPGTLVKKGLPTVLIALATASSAACFGSNVATSEEKYGVDRSLVRFGIPLGMVIHKPVSAIYNMALICFFADQYGVACSPTWLIAGVLICAILAIAAPPIPGGGTVAYSMLFLQMGIPADALALTMALDVVMDFVLTSLEMFLLPLMLVNISGRLALLDRETLRKSAGN